MKKLFLTKIILIVIVILALSFGLASGQMGDKIMLGDGFNNPTPTATPIAIASITPTPTSTSDPSINLSPTATPPPNVNPTVPELPTLIAVLILVCGGLIAVGMKVSSNHKVNLNEQPKTV